MEKIVLLCVIIAGSLLFMLSLCKNKWESATTFLLRMTAGLLGIYLANQLLGYAQSGVVVGINAATVGVTALLGLPGFVLLYALSYLLFVGMPA